LKYTDKIIFLAVPHRKLCYHTDALNPWWTLFMSFRQDFIESVNATTIAFPDNATALRILNGAFSIADYHLLLLSMFHSSYEAPSASSLAAAHCPAEQASVRDLLLRNAIEGADHWQWILNDLEATGFTGPDPRHSFPITETQAYVAYNHYIASRSPAARLAIAAAVESISRSFGTNYSTKVFQCLSLKPSQTSFFFRKAESSTTLQTVLKAFDAAPLSDEDWRWVINATRTAGALYKAIYDAR
jgi:hypothetical protein